MALPTLPLHPQAQDSQHSHLPGPLQGPRVSPPASAPWKGSSQYPCSWQCLFPSPQELGSGEDELREGDGGSPTSLVSAPPCAPPVSFLPQSPTAVLRPPLGLSCAGLPLLLEPQSCQPSPTTLWSRGLTAAEQPDLVWGGSGQHVLGGEWRLLTSYCSHWFRPACPAPALSLSRDPAPPSLHPQPALLPQRSAPRAWPGAPKLDTPSWLHEGLYPLPQPTGPDPDPILAQAWPPARPSTCFDSPTSFWPGRGSPHPLCSRSLCTAAGPAPGDPASDPTEPPLQGGAEPTGTPPGQGRLPSRNDGVVTLMCWPRGGPDPPHRNCPVYSTHSGPWGGGEDRTFGDWMPAQPCHPPVSVTHMAICAWPVPGGWGPQWLGHPALEQVAPLRVRTGRGSLASLACLCSVLCWARCPAGLGTDLSLPWPGLAALTGKKCSPGSASMAPPAKEACSRNFQG